MCAAFCFLIEVWGAHAPSRANFGASPKFFCESTRRSLVGEAPTTAREGACAPGKYASPLGIGLALDYSKVMN